MNTSVTYTSTLSPKLMTWLDEHAATEGLSKKNIIEAALNLYRIQEKKKELAQMFTELSQEEETLTLAESGLGDYVEQLKKQDE